MARPSWLRRRASGAGPFISGPELTASGLHEIALSLQPRSRLIFCDDSEVGKPRACCPMSV